MRRLILSAALLAAAPASADDLADFCVAEGEAEAVCDCTETAVYDDTGGTDRELFLEVAILSGLIREDGTAATTAWNEAVVEVAGSFGYGVGDVFEIVNRVDGLYRRSLANCR